MKKKKLVYLFTIVVVVAAALGGLLLLRRSSAPSLEYTTATVERGEISVTITSTGTLEPVSVVDVGTQVSGIIKKVYADFNDTVKKGQLIAELDRTVLSGALDEAIANRDRVKALFDLAEAEFKRSEPLFSKGFLSEQEFAKIRTDYLTEKAALLSAEAAVVKARTNLQYASITSPINGTVIQRNVEAGQTVAASFSAPTLFVIAEDLKKMRILASVDETDIGSIRHGQQVRFSVQAFTAKTFTGTVEQIRLQPAVTQNVVTYTVVIAVANSDGTLLPGMTATVDFIVEKASDVLMVPNAALRFNPAGAESVRRRRVAGLKDSSRHGKIPQDSTFAQRRQLRVGEKDAENKGGAKAAVWILSHNRELRPVIIRTGITDGRMTEIRSADERLAEGTAVVTGTKAAGEKKVRSVSILPQPRPFGGRR